MFLGRFYLPCQALPLLTHFCVTGLFSGQSLSLFALQNTASKSLPYLEAGQSECSHTPHRLALQQAIGVSPCAQTNVAPSLNLDSHLGMPNFSPLLFFWLVFTHKLISSMLCLMLVKGITYFYGELLRPIFLLAHRQWEGMGKGKSLSINLYL